MPKKDSKFGKAKPICLTIPVDLLRKLDELVTSEHSTRSGVIYRLLVKLLYDGGDV